ncbi:TPA: hypothetical protein T7L01_001311 [Streptococcus suis]|nr:hypothetical protein [Streptococcus suis]HEM5075221.1 hypothetical protein [Streptococcus suis]
MIDRSYLPFESARHYQDRKMQKWMGLFLSEHTSALSDDDKQVSYLSDLSLNQKLMLLSQSYANQLTIQVTRIQKNDYQNIIGTIPTLSTKKVILKTNDGHIAIALEDIMAITLVEEVYNESA